MITFGTKIKQLRKAHGYDQNFLANYLNVQRQSVSMWERNCNTCTEENLLKLAELFNVEPGYLRYNENTLGMLLEYKLCKELGIKNLTEQEKEELSDKIVEIYKIIKQEEEHNLFFFTWKEREEFLLKIFLKNAK